MLINADFKALEWLGAVYLSGDPVGYKEIREGVDLHEDNRVRFKLPERLHAKTFLFRLIYGGSAYAYANDALFTHISAKESYWQGIIDELYKKYYGLKLWHDELMQTAMSTGKIVIPTGREFHFKPERNFKGENKWPRTTILNYPVQGFGADLMVLVRLLLKQYLAEAGLHQLQLVCTVHDSILIDTIRANVAAVVEILSSVWTNLPKEFERQFGLELDLPTKCEIQVGPNWKDMTEWQMPK